MDNGIREKNLYYYHPDHLGSSSYITDREGRITQHTEYSAFGEVLFEEHSTATTMPYLFNGKELDTETGLYYYGARYYDPRVSLWLNVDPLAEKTMTPYAYTNNNPIMLVDPTGKEAENCCDFIKGAGLTIIDDIAGTNFRNIYGSNNSSYRSGVNAGHTIAFIGSAILAADGTASIGAGTAGLVASGGAAATGVGVPVGVIGAVGSGTLIAKGAVEVVVAGVIVNNITKNRAEDSNRQVVDNATNNNKKKKKETGYGQGAEHTKEARPSTRKRYGEGMVRKERDRRGEKGDARRE